MFRQTVNIATGDSAMKTYITHPENSGLFAPIILYMDIWGIREELRVIARRITKIGYACILPDLYYRQGDDVGTAYYDENGRMISLHKLDDLRTERVQAARAQLTGNMVMRDTEAIMHFMIPKIGCALALSDQSDGVWVDGWSYLLPATIQIGFKLVCVYMALS